jgi:membrane protease YdiL (CAAX protease family)
MTPLDHLLAFVLIVALPGHNIWNGVQLARHPGSAESGSRIRRYLGSIAVQWTLTLWVAALWLWNARSWAALGLVWPAGWALWVSGALCAITIAFLVIQLRSLRVSASAQASLRAQLEGSPGTRLVIPATARELRGFAALAVTAGICEEVLYRGYLLWYLAAHLPFGFAIAAAVATFGIGHAYQGLRGVLLTGAVGAIPLGVLWWTGSLAAPIVMHATTDLVNGFMLYRARQPEPGAEADKAPAIQESAVADP